MTPLSKTIEINEQTIYSPNVAKMFDSHDLGIIAAHVYKGYNSDEMSRERWMARVSQSMDLAMQVSEAKNTPWPNAANIKFPLATIAALQFHARAYPSIVRGGEVVRYTPHEDDIKGPDGKGIDEKRAKRITNHINWQLLSGDSSWEEQHDRMLVNLPIVGCAFKKTFSNPNGMVTSDLVLAVDLAMDYYAKSVEECARKTHIVRMYKNDIHELIMQGLFEDIRDDEVFQSSRLIEGNSYDARRDSRTGTSAVVSDDDTPLRLLEQHCNLDLDGDGYKEPWVVTIDEGGRRVLRIVSRIASPKDVLRNGFGEIIRIKPIEYFTKYGFIPSPDGAVYDVGFGTLLGPLNETVNSLINQLVDAGTMTNTAGGFIGRGAKLMGGSRAFAPFQWNPVESTGDDLRKSIFPLPVREPSPVLFQLLTLIINFTGRISGTTETMMGENPGQNTPAQTTQTMVEQGMKVYNAIFKRIWRSMSGEFRKVYLLNREHTPEEKRFGGEGDSVYREDYKGSPDSLLPSTDPAVISDSARLGQIMAVKQAAASTPGYDIEAVERRFLEVLNIENPSGLYLGLKERPPTPNPLVQIEQLKSQARMQVEQLKALQAKNELDTEKAMFLAELIEERRVNSSKIIALEAKAVKDVASARGAEAGHQIAAFDAQLGALKAHDAAMGSRIDKLFKMGLIPGVDSGEASTKEKKDDHEE